jgi:flagellar biogenesis protein FliO
VETAIPLGERRSLVIVSVEGRRLLLGLTSTNISLVTELRAGATGEVLGTRQ